MITKGSLPSSYTPYESLNVCSNEFIGGGHLVAMGDVLPLVVGSGEQPMIWLQAPSNPDATEFILLVDASVSHHPAVSVLNTAEGLVISVGSTLILRVKQASRQEATVDVIDLRPLGVNIFGDDKGLTAGGAQFTQNVLAGSVTLIAFGKQPS